MQQIRMYRRATVLRCGAGHFRVYGLANLTLNIIEFCFREDGFRASTTTTIIIIIIIIIPISHRAYFVLYILVPVVDVDTLHYTTLQYIGWS